MRAQRPCHGYGRRWGGALLLAVWTLFGGSLTGEAHPPRYRVAVLLPGGVFSAALEGFREGLAQLGYPEGPDLTLMVEDAHGEVASLADRAVRLAAAKPDVIFTVSTAPTAAAMHATTTIPVVFAFVADPLRSGLIASYASSQNNLTGITSYAGPLTGKRLEILQELAPGIKRVLVLVAPQEPVSQMAFQFLADVAPKLGLELLRLEVTSKEELVQRLQAVPTGAVDAIYYNPSNLVGAHLDLLIQKAKADRIPLAVTDPSMVERGALVAYGPDMRLVGRQAAKLGTKILQGAKPSELPVQMPAQLPLTINLSTAKAIGLSIPRGMLERAESLVE